MSGIQFGKLVEVITNFSYLDIQKNKQALHEMINELDTFHDPYDATIAHLLLSFCCMCTNDSDACKEHLAIAKKNIKANSFQFLEIKYNFIQVTYYGLLGNDQDLTQLYIKGLKEVKLVKDKETEILLLNSLASKFIAYDDYEHALSYGLNANSLALELPRLNESVFMQVIYNLVEIYIEMGQYDKASEYITAYDNIQSNCTEKELRKACNALYLYSKTDHLKEAVLAADIMIQHKSEVYNNKVFGFDLCKRACLAMLDLSQERYAYVFLDFMKELLEERYITQSLCQETIEMKVYTTFVKNKNLEQLYRKYFYVKHTIDSQQNISIREGMKAKLDFFNVVSERKKLESFQNKLKEKVYIDELTGVYNRAYFDKTLKEIKLEEEGTLGILSVDVDFFKEYNDTYGHVLGDKALRIIGECLRSNEILNMAACRCGGDEFICICKNIELEQINAYVSSLRESLYDANIAHKSSRISDRMTISIGYYQQNLQKKNAVSEAIELADQALYKSKLKGRNTFTNLEQYEGMPYDV